MKVILLSGSVRPQRQTHKVAVELAKRLNSYPEVEAEVVDLEEYPLPYLTDLVARLPEPPPGARKLERKMNEADAFIFASPEYNGSYTGALKNTVDYFPKSTYQKKVIGVATVTTGAMGGMRAAQQMQQLVLALWAYPLPQMLLVPGVKEKFNAQDQLTDEAFAEKVDAYLGEFLWLAEAVATRKEQELVAVE